MEPPPKRLRMLRSVEIDDDDQEYFRKRQESARVLKNKFESIFAKFENMPESQSDDIDMGNGTVVVDRGHLRSLAIDKQGAMAAQAVGDLISNRTGGALDDYNEDSEDELAPPEASRSLPPTKSEQISPGSRPSEAAEAVVPSVHLTSTPQPPVINQLQLLSVLGPALQAAPQTLDPQNHNALLMGLGQVVLQAMSQALPQVLSNHLGVASNPPAMVSSHPATTPTTTSILAPPTDPKWNFPPLPETRAVVASPSIPVPVATIPRKRLRALSTAERSGQAKRSSASRKALPAALQQVSASVSDELALQEKVALDITGDYGTQTDARGSPNLQSEEDFSIQDVPEQYTPEIPEIPETSPIEQDEFVEPAPTACVTVDRHRHSEEQGSYGRSASELQRQLLTPTSLACVKSSDSQTDDYQGEPELTVTAYPTTTFSDEDLELLSLAGDEPSEAGVAIESFSEVSEHPDSAVLPSVEAVDLTAADIKPEFTPTYRRSSVQVRIPPRPAAAVPALRQASSPPPSLLPKTERASAAFISDSDSIHSTHYSQLL